MKIWIEFLFWDLKFIKPDLKEAGCDFPEGKRLVSPWMDASGFIKFKSQNKELIKLKDLNQAGCTFPKRKMIVSPWMDGSGFMDFRSWKRNSIRKPSSSFRSSTFKDLQKKPFHKRVAIFLKSNCR
tara:strand:+ start:769 stop:1146 length:378 start_codon:yes stop_codon:yes gene_type:complete